ncbi:hypothetical protein [Sphingomonas mali]|uniref:hypothetical protein n=1 Tax=Sphingomonas mali TaxID=40682 RepID=UPI00083311BF|nr:hypothetical protein [Sphingomonas mali]
MGFGKLGGGRTIDKFCRLLYRDRVNLQQAFPDLYADGFIGLSNGSWAKASLLEEREYMREAV